MSGGLSELTETVARLAESVERIENKLEAPGMGEHIVPKFPDPNEKGAVEAEEVVSEEVVSEEDAEIAAEIEADHAKVREALESFQSSLDGIDTTLELELDLSGVKDHCGEAEDAARNAQSEVDELLSAVDDFQQQARDIEAELERMRGEFTKLLELVEPWFEEEEEEEEEDEEHEEEAEEEGEEAEDK